MSDDYDGPVEIGYARWPGRGTSYRATFGTHELEVYITEKQKRVRIYVDGKKWEESK